MAKRVSPVKAHLAMRRMHAARVAVHRKPLGIAKKQAIDGSQSARRAPVEDVRDAFGFVPVDAEIEVIAWPKL